MNPAERLAAAIAGLQYDLARPDPLAGLTPADIETLTRLAPDAGTLKRWFKRRLAHEPIAYIAGAFEYHGQRFAIDKRAYITDPESIHLVEAVARRVRELAVTLGRPPLVAEVGVGCATLSLSVKRRAPDSALVGLDLDPDALVVAAENVKLLGLPVRLIESDLFERWPMELPAPDLIFGDPPWGDETTLYADDRPADHYSAMPAASAFPIGGLTGVHRQILRAVVQRGWGCEVWLNGGCLPLPEVHALGKLAARYEFFQPAPGLSLLCCHAV